MNAAGWPIVLCDKARILARFPRLVARAHRSNYDGRQLYSSDCQLPYKNKISGTHQYRDLGRLDDIDIASFRERHFKPEVPTILPRHYFCDLPASERWFKPSVSETNISRLNIDYLTEHGGDAYVPLELTPGTEDTHASKEDGTEFRKFQAPLSLFLQWIRAAEKQSQDMRLYLAQCQLLDLPPTLRDDFPTPELVLQAGKGDIYDTNVWIGLPPTYTPLHRDPNPNLFVQLAGCKIVRLLAPEDGLALFGTVRRYLGKSGTREAASFRGEEMMQGQEREIIEQLVWNDVDPSQLTSVSDSWGYEARLEAGDGLFIPNGWWHSIKGVGNGVTASVNWWFR
ncbi:hypothetical protein ASPZODRAFT_18370 [Penicilliopsis zonata CBS 506.65]|uniref:JmjC domain-containing protein n=1 Tax=Penicilliopsis zonata CBS 506.65 TaxID=1073090 RepID=A0A1L9SCI9_9EURO|nr:hypothetical protein ASPZODRAFT_18370 [Penicilliopsis zonata CBS 506.65]OJJ44807.1 hypothetical protein ASPZODRAFT_18370 [Penicilliopsis zonata CBS 506.65]